MRFGNESLKEHVQRGVRRLGWSIHDAALHEEVEGPALVAKDDVYLSPRALRSLKKTIRAALGEQKLRLRLPASRMMDLTLPLQKVHQTKEGTFFDVAFVPAGQKATPEELFSSHETALDLPNKELLVDVKQPRFILQQESNVLQFPFSTTLVMQVRHWVHALRLSHLLPQILLLEKALSQPFRSALKALAAIRPSKDTSIAQLKRRFVFRGKNVVIHPSAVVEASVIGNNVRIGPHASVIDSVIGDDVIIEDRVHVFQSVLGKSSFLSRNSSMSACLIMGNTDACANGIQACVVDEEVGLTSFARPLDLSLVGQVKVKDDDQLVDSGELPCGVFFSRGSFIGGGVTIGAGRVVPPNLSLIAGPETVFRNFPSIEDCKEKDSHTWTLSGGRLSPVTLPNSSPASLKRSHDVSSKEK
ncbi:MAG: hypothetical protein GY822_16355 [Deltaproteobacteria bacterium]|nr:hypothetical protein [Deltaproteobacteria bacterium]